jgi:hypothetical protein
MNAINLVDVRYRLEQAKDWLAGTGGRMRLLQRPLHTLHPRSPADTSIASSEVVKAWTDAGIFRPAQVQGRSALPAAVVNSAMRSWR